MEELAKDFEILIVAWLKSDDENATNLAYSLAKHAQTLQLLQTDVIKSVCIHCNKEKEVKRIDGSYWCKDCRKGW
ncbi:hypothetical protein IVB69_00010 [Flavobacterium sp. J49]|uniref:hypothetical protein n=1 Tax=Flavobacterium sp. J49 TaxID=2718534 RepID=UPI001594A091|nr:hypothetical protein [Flavobacterium sp. J49]MBF6639851.1 hypothetical protein [Flavobacterium sp. J49]NIC01092.1 hypothetical protein [Flavobacterium sp. J49]